MEGGGRGGRGKYMETVQLEVKLDTNIMLGNFNHVKEILTATQKKFTSAGALNFQLKVYIFKYCEKLHCWRTCSLIFLCLTSFLHVEK